MDGTLIDSLWVWNEVDIEFLKMHNLSLPKDLHSAIEGLSFDETANYFKSRFHLRESIDDIKSVWVDMVRDVYSNKVKAKKGAYDFLKLLKASNYKTAIATSNFKTLAISVLQNNNLLNFFDTIITTCEVSKSKSSPDVYLEAAKRLKTSPSNCLVFEDTKIGVSGATLAGMKVIGVYDKLGTCSKEELSSMTCKTITNFEELYSHNCLS